MRWSGRTTASQVAQLGRYPLAGVALAASPIMWGGTEHPGQKTWAHSPLVGGAACSPQAPNIDQIQPTSGAPPSWGGLLTPRLLQNLAPGEVH